MKYSLRYKDDFNRVFITTVNSMEEIEYIKERFGKDSCLIEHVTALAPGTNKQQVDFLKN